MRFTFDETFAQATGVKAKSVQYADRCADSRDNRAWDADDGSSFDLQSDHLSGADVDACMQNISSVIINSAVISVLCLVIGIAISLCMGNSRRSKCCHRKCCGSSGVFYCRNDTMQKVTVPTASFVKPHGCFLWPVLLFYS